MPEIQGLTEEPIVESSSDVLYDFTYENIRARHSCIIYRDAHLDSAGKLTLDNVYDEEYIYDDIVYYCNICDRELTDVESHIREYHTDIIEEETNG